MPDASTTTTNTRAAYGSWKSKGSFDSRITDHIKSLVSISQVVGSSRARLRCQLCQSEGEDLQLRHQNDSFKCFRCGKFGDVFSWVMAEDNLDFKQALRKLAAMAGVSLHTPKERTETLAAVMNQYREALSNSKRAKDWLTSRGLPESLWFRANIGYAAGMPEEVPIKALKDCLLVDEDTLQPWFYDRVIFAVHNRHHQVVHLQGRTLVKDLEPKYLPTKSQTALGHFPLNDFLYGEEQLDLVTDDIFLTEGVPDALTVRQYGLLGFGIFGNDGFGKHGHKFKKAKRVFWLGDNDEASRAKALGNLIQLQARLPQAIVYDVLLPKPDGQKKQDVNSWYLDAGCPAETVFMDMVQSCAKPVIEVAIADWGLELGRHDALIDLIANHNQQSRWLRQLAAASGEPLVALQYLSRLRSIHVHS